MNTRSIAMILMCWSIKTIISQVSNDVIWQHTHSMCYLQSADGVDCWSNAYIKNIPSIVPSLSPTLSTISNYVDDIPTISNRVPSSLYPTVYTISTRVPSALYPTVSTISSYVDDIPTIISQTNSVPTIAPQVSTIYNNFVPTSTYSPDIQEIKEQIYDLELLLTKLNNGTDECMNDVNNLAVDLQDLKGNLTDFINEKFYELQLFFFPTIDPTSDPSTQPTTEPTTVPTADPSLDPTNDPTNVPTLDPTIDPTIDPTVLPTTEPTADPTAKPTLEPSVDPTTPSAEPSRDPTLEPTSDPTTDPTADPTTEPTAEPTLNPTNDPTIDPTVDPTTDPTNFPTLAPTAAWIEGLTLGGQNNTYHGENIDIGMDAFNSIFAESDYYIIKRECVTCSESYAELYYKRVTSPGSFDAYSAMKSWTDIDNAIHQNFRLFESMEAALTDDVNGMWYVCATAGKETSAFGHCSKYGVPELCQYGVDADDLNFDVDDPCNEPVKFSIFVGSPNNYLGSDGIPAIANEKTEIKDTEDDINGNGECGDKYINISFDANQSDFVIISLIGLVIIIMNIIFIVCKCGCCKVTCSMPKDYKFKSIKFAIDHDDTLETENNALEMEEITQ